MSARGVSCDKVQLSGALTRETLPLPLSLTVKTNDSSSPLTGSVKVRNAWCGFFAVFPSTVVRSSFNESVAPRETVLARGAEALSLAGVSHHTEAEAEADMSGGLTCSWKLRLRQRLCWQWKRWHLQSSRPQQMQLRRPKAAAKTRNRKRPSYLALAKE